MRALTAHRPARLLGHARGVGYGEPAVCHAP